MAAYPRPPTFKPLSVYEHGQGHGLNPRPSPLSLPSRAAPHPAPVVAPRAQPYGGLFSGSLWDQANHLADYLLGPLTAQYQQQLSSMQGMDAQRLAQLQAYIAQVAQGLSGVAPQVLAAYQGAAHDQAAFGQGFSDAVKTAVQGEADKENQLLSQIGAPSGQMIPGSQSVDVGDVTYGLGGYIPATLLAAQGAQAYSEAAGLPGLIQQRGLGIVGDLMSQQQQAEQALTSQYQQALAGRPQNVLDFLGQLQDRQATNRAAQAKQQSDAIAAAQAQAKQLTDATGYLYVVDRFGHVKRATDSAGKPVQTLAGIKASQGPTPPRPLVVGSSSAGWRIFDPVTGDVIGTVPPGAPQPVIKTDSRTGLTTAVDPRTGKILWRQRTGAPAPPPVVKPIIKSDPRTGMTTAVDPQTGKVIWRQRTAAAQVQPPHFYQVGNEQHVAWQDPKTGQWQDTVIATGPAKLVTHFDPKTGMTTAVDPATGKVVWRQRTGSEATPKPPDTFSSNGRAYTWVQNKYGNWQAVPIGPDKPAQSKFTPLEISRFKSDAADSAYDAFWGVKDKDGNVVSQPKHYQEALSDLIAHGIPLDIAQQALNRFWKRPGFDADIQNRVNGKIVWYHAGVGRPRVPFQKRPKGQAAAETAAGGGKGPAVAGYPLGVLGDLIGFPYQGTHTQFGNWESDNAVDIKVPVGTPVYAVTDGVIGQQIGPLDSSNPQLAGNRLHLVAGNNEYYYAHLSRLTVKAGQRVKAGQLLGYSGEANGVAHLHFAEKTGDPTSLAKPEAQPAAAPYSPQAAMTTSGARNIGRDLAANRYGWTKNQWAALNALINSESGWNYKAVNPSSGALGIGQALGHTLPPDYAENPIVQILWMLQYVKKRYGDPVSAWAFKRAHGWY